MLPSIPRRFRLVAERSLEMLQRCISLFVIVGFVASQLAAIPHAHSWCSSTEQQKHDSTPHVHLDWLASSNHRHEHSHGGRTHSHSHNEHSDSTPAEDQNESAPVQDSGDHDASAISVSVLLGMPASGGNGVTGTTTSQLQAVDVPTVCHIDLKSFRPINWHPPDSAWADSHLYISLRNLRI